MRFLLPGCWFHTFLFLLPAFLGLPCAVEAQQGVYGNIIGEVHVAKVGFPFKPVMVNLQNRGATVNSVYTDDEGKFGFYALPAGLYHLIINDDDYVPADEAVDLNPLITATRFAQVMLNVKQANKDGGSTDRVGGSNPGMVDISEYLRKFPNKTVKEYEKGLQARTSGHADSAEKHFNKALEYSPDFYPAHNELGSLLVNREQFAEAEKEFSRAIQLNHGDAEAHLNLANVYLLQKHYDSAEVNAQEGLRRQPSSAFGHFVLGAAYEHMGRFAEAERELRQALELDPFMANVHLELVNLYLAQQRKPQAEDELRTFLSKFPNDARAGKARDVLSKLEQR
jgi:tetratricopeptide (TPR) repeat protein